DGRRVAGMKRLTPLERMFVEEFCRFTAIEGADTDQLRVLERDRNPVGFITTLDPMTVPGRLRWGARVFNSPRVAVVGPEKIECGSLLFFDKKTGALDAIEGFVYGEAWPDPEAPAYWSEISRVNHNRGRP
ncbi:MAG: hypothetical protein Q8Q62_15730, partial [Mesorhizobium sp.]|nr:hypothetical protein [Mesorhizobium sp.]